jgi:hypothetical protein
MKSLSSLKHTITIDPGIHTAVAIWYSDTKYPAELFTVNEKGIIQNARKAFRECMELISNPNLYKTFIEGVRVYGSSAKSVTSATRGDLQELAYRVGALNALFSSETGSVEIIQPNEWKGQLDDRALRLRIKRATGIRPNNPHEAATVGMGLALRGWL